MKIEIIFLIYALIFRLCVMLTGIISIILGYRLYIKGLYSDHNSKSASLNATIGGWKLALKNAGPGTFFALFGLIIIQSMIQNGNPELVSENYYNKGKISQAAKNENEQNPGDENNNLKTKLNIRGQNEQKCMFCTLLEKTDQFQKNKDITGEINAYKNALEQVSDPLNELAWLWFENDDKKLQESLVLIQAAIIFRPDDADYWDSMAEILFKLKSYDKAYNAIIKASQLNNKYINKIAKFKKMID